MRHRKNHEPLTAAVRRFALAALLCATARTDAAQVVVLLRNGDRITGELIAQETNRVVVVTSWAGTLSLPLETIGGVQTVSGEKMTLAAAPAPLAPSPSPVIAAASAKPQSAPPPAAPKRTHTNVQLGSNLVFGGRDSAAVYARLKSTYEKPYTHDPKKFFRAIADYTADYGETEGIRSADRMTASVKTDFDLGPRSYFYNVGSGGYDEIRKIKSHYEFGPGLGSHVIKRPAFEFNLEGGLNYQVQHRSAGDTLESLYLRGGEDATWRFGPRFSLTKKFEFFLDGENVQQFRFRLDTTLSYKLIENLSLNLSLLDMYDTAPAPNVDKNELQIRSSVGITF